MQIGLVHVRLSIPSAQSLKERRRVLRGIKDRLKALNVSVAEVGDCEHWQTAELAVVAVTRENAGMDIVLNQVADIVHGAPEAVVTEHTQERL